MTQEYELEDDVVKELAISGIGFANKLGLGQFLPSNEVGARKAVDAWLVAHDAQIRAEAWEVGHDTGSFDAEEGVESPNPYRKENES